ncbi:unnamed protein product [Cylicocyclus nassatus]|uniref:Uncharacterized protein n=1 Tax=Cylicocyclus nassatus TaxID=53992 RepID=A0AA36GYX2_CYLNA|nr:unnamed protein product [Cylicocyclus nassatus]
MAKIPLADKLKAQTVFEKLPNVPREKKEINKPYTNSYNFNRNFMNQWTNAASNGGVYPSFSDSMRYMYNLQMYDKANGTSHANEFGSILASNMRNPNNSMYNPYYVGGTNNTIRDNLASLGFEVPENITKDYIDALDKYVDYSAVSYGINNAPNGTGNANQKLAYNIYQLRKDEADTVKAEEELSSLQNYIKLWVKQGYSDNDIRNKAAMLVGNDSGFSTLKKMDENLANRTPVSLNRSVKYSADSINGFIWNARNNANDVNLDSAIMNYSVGYGNIYHMNSKSEAALDPTNRETYNPYGHGYAVGSAANLAVKYGVDKFDRKWLETNSSLLKGTDKQRNDYLNAQTYVEMSEQAEAELTKLKEWAKDRISKGADPDNVYNELISYEYDPFTQKYSEKSKLDTEYPTLAKMEKARSIGDYEDMATLRTVLPKKMRRKKKKISAPSDKRSEIPAKESAPSAKEPVRPYFEGVDVISSADAGYGESSGGMSSGSSGSRSSGSYARGNSGATIADEPYFSIPQYEKMGVKDKAGFVDDVMALLNGRNTEDVSEEARNFYEKYGVLFEGERSYTATDYGTKAEITYDARKEDTVKNTYIGGEYISGTKLKEDYIGDTMYSALSTAEDALSDGKNVHARFR